MGLSVPPLPNPSFAPACIYQPCLFYGLLVEFVVSKWVPFIDIVFIAVHQQFTSFSYALFMSCNFVCDTQQLNFQFCLLVQFLYHYLDIQEGGNEYIATVHCTWHAHQDIVYNLQFSFDEDYVYSIGKNDGFLLQSELAINHVPEATRFISECRKTRSFKIKAGAVSTVQVTNETHCVCGQFFCLMPCDDYILTSSYTQGTVYKVHVLYLVMFFRVFDFFRS